MFEDMAVRRRGVTWRHPAVGTAGSSELNEHHATFRRLWTYMGQASMHYPTVTKLEFNTQSLNIFADGTAALAMRLDDYVYGSDQYSNCPCISISTLPRAPVRFLHNHLHNDMREGHHAGSFSFFLTHLNQQRAVPLA